MYVFLINGIILTVSALIMRLVMVWFNAYISSKIGTEGMGLYTLVMSVYAFAVTVAISGMGLACTRLVAEEISKKNHLGVRFAVKRCAALSFLFGVIALGAIYIFSGFIGEVLLQNKMTVISLKAFALSLPFLSLSCILNGYFTATGRVIKSSAVQFAELFTRIFVTSLLLNNLLSKTMEYSCLAVVLGGTIAETASCIYYSAIYFTDIKRYSKKGDTSGIKRKIFSISIPVALSSYLKSGLSTLKHILIPIQLKKSGMSAGMSLSKYGIINGMVMPVIMFPSAIIISFSSLILPEISKLYVNGKYSRINRSVSKIFKITLLFSIGVTGVFMYYSDYLGQMIYKNSEAGLYICLIAPLTAIMYLDAVTDSILKGINQQVGVVKINIIDTVTCIILIYYLLPLYSVNGYIMVIFVSEILNGVLSVGKLIKSVNFDFLFVNWILKPAVCAVASSFCISRIGLEENIASIMLFFLIYLIFLFGFKCIKFKNI